MRVPSKKKILFVLCISVTEGNAMLCFAKRRISKNVIIKNLRGEDVYQNFVASFVSTE